MKYTEEQLNYVALKKPEYKFKTVPSLDLVIVKFLEKYEVYVKPASSTRRTADDVRSGALAGAIGGFAGADVAGDAFIIKGQQKQTAIQEWTQWKQWALDHKDFEAFRVENIDNVKKINEVVFNNLNDSDIKEIDILFKNANGATWSTFSIIYTTCAFSILLVGLLAIPIMNFVENRDSNKSSFYYQEFIKK